LKLPARMYRNFLSVISVLVFPLLSFSSAGQAGVNDYRHLLTRGDCATAIPVLRREAERAPASAGYFLALCLDRSDRLRFSSKGTVAVKPASSSGIRNEIISRLKDAIEAGNMSAIHYLATYQQSLNPDREAAAPLSAFAQAGNLLANHQLSSVGRTRPRSRKDIYTELQIAIAENDDERAKSVLKEYWHTGEANFIEDEEIDPLSLAILSKRRALSGWILTNETKEAGSDVRLGQLKRTIATNQHDLATSLLNRYRTVVRGIPIEEQVSLAGLAANHGQIRLAKSIIDAKTLEQILKHELKNLDDSLTASLISQLANPAEQRLAWLRRWQGDATSTYYGQPLSRLAALTGYSGVLEATGYSQSIWLHKPGIPSLAETSYLRSKNANFAGFNTEVVPYNAVSTLIELAIEKRDVHLLVTVLPQVSIQDILEVNAEQTPLWKAVDAGTEVWQPVLDWQGVDNRTDSKGRNLLSRAIIAGNLPLANELIRLGIELHSFDKLNRTPLWYAAKKGEAELVGALAARNDLVNVPDATGQTPLMSAVDSGKTETARRLIGFDAALNKQSEQGNSALMLAATRHPKVVGLLLENSADLKLRNGSSMTALMIASEHGCLDCVKLLLEAGANPKRKNSKGKNSLDLAATKQILAALN